MSRKVALVTGANRGLGLELATQLGQRGLSVIITGRNNNAAQAASGRLRALGYDVDAMGIDVSDPNSIRAGLAKFRERYDKLDVLVNNAGVLLDEDDSILSLSEDDARQTLTVNALGPLWMVQTFEPVLSHGSRVINVSSGGGQICGGISTWSPMYCVSKTALNAITAQLAAALAHRGISVNAVCPGWVRTDMGGKRAPRSVAEGAETPLWLACEAPPELTGKFFRDKREIHW